MSVTRLRYGDLTGQSGDLWLPTDPIGPLPVVVVIHGGFWRAARGKRIMSGFSRALTAYGWAVWNIEYRRVGRGGGGGGWPTTLVDVAAAIDHLAELDGLDLSRVVTCGHSAGGHFALWAAGRSRLTEDAPGSPVRVAVRAAVSLAGVADLVAAAELDLGSGAAERFLAGSPAQWPDRYQMASPAALLPLGVPQVLVHGLADQAVPAAMSERYVALATSLGDDAIYRPLEGLDHRSLIDTEGPAWNGIVADLTRLLR